MAFSKHNSTDVEISRIDWHVCSVDDVCQRLSTSLVHGLDSGQVTRKRIESGKNEHSPPPSHIMRRLFFYVFGGFGSLLIIAGVLCCVAWKPLGEPVPQISNLALGVVLFIVATLQAVFNAWQAFLPLTYLILGLEYQPRHRFDIRDAPIGSHRPP